MQVVLGGNDLRQARDGVVEAFGGQRAAGFFQPGVECGVGARLGSARRIGGARDHFRAGVGRRGFDFVIDAQPGRRIAAARGAQRRIRLAAGIEGARAQPEPGHAIHFALRDEHRRAQQRRRLGHGHVAELLLRGLEVHRKAAGLLQFIADDYARGRAGTLHADPQAAHAGGRRQHVFLDAVPANDQLGAAGEPGLQFDAAHQAHGVPGQQSLDGELRRRRELAIRTNGQSHAKFIALAGRRVGLVTQRAGEIQREVHMVIARRHAAAGQQARGLGGSAGSVQRQRGS